MELEAGEKTCRICGKEFKEGYNLRIHILTIHKVHARFVVAPKGSFKCPVCGLAFTLKGNLVRHEKNVHTDYTGNKNGEMDEDSENVSYKCAMCEYGAKQRDSLSQHYETSHPESGVARKRVNFENEKVFQDYKRQLEMAQCSVFSLQTCRKTETTTYRYYKCSREATNKNDGSRKSHNTTTTCAAYMKVRITSAGVHADLVETHVHSLDPAKLPMTTHQRQTLESWIDLGLSTERILENCRAQGPESRLHYIRAAELKQFKTKRECHWKMCDSDHASLSKRMEEQADCCPILSLEEPHNAKGEGFRCVIISKTQKEWIEKYSKKGISIDATFNISRYTYKLSTIMVIDNKGRFLPAAFFLSQRCDSDEYQYFFNKVKQACPSFAPETIITDDDNSYYNGFRKCFPNAAIRKLLCVYHVSLNLHEKARTLIKDKEFACSLKKSINELLSVPRKDEFRKNLLTVLNQLEKTEETRFFNYLRDNLCGREEEWAQWARLKSVFNTTTGNESFHNVLKSYRLFRRESVRIDELVDILVNFCEWKREDVLISERRELSNSSYRMSTTSEAHHKALAEFAPDSVFTCGDRMYVRSSDKSSEYELLFLGPCACLKGDNSHCTRCDACPFEYRCSCPQGSKKGTVCKHGHVRKMHGQHIEPHLYGECVELHDPEPIIQMEESNGAGSLRQEETSTTKYYKTEVASTTENPKSQALQELAELQNLLAAIQKRAIHEAKKGETDLIRETTSALNNVAIRYELTTPGPQTNLGRPRKMTLVAETMHVVKRTKQQQIFRKLDSATPLAPISPEEQSICGDPTCFQEEPLVDIQPGEELPAIHWTRCTLCRQAYHAECRKPRRDLCYICNGHIEQWYLE